MRVNNMGDQGVGDIVIDDLEGLHREIHDYNEGGGRKPEDISPSLERYLLYVAKSGNIVFPWNHVKTLFRSKIQHAMEQFPGEMCPNTESFVMERFELFRAAPFTIQRLTELITQPTRHYKKKEKFLRGLEKTVLVVTTVEPWTINNDVKNGNDSSDEGEMDQGNSENEESFVNRSYNLQHHIGLHSHEEMQGPEELMMRQVHHSNLQPSNDVPGLVISGDVLESISPNSAEHGILITSEGNQSPQNINTVVQDNFVRHEAILDNVTTTMVTIMSDANHSHSQSTTSQAANENISPMVVVEEISAERTALVIEENKEKYQRDLDNAVVVVSSIDSVEPCEESSAISTNAPTTVLHTQPEFTEQTEMAEIDPLSSLALPVQHVEIVPEIPIPIIVGDAVDLLHDNSLKPETDEDMLTAATTASAINIQEQDANIITPQFVSYPEVLTAEAEVDVNLTITPTETEGNPQIQISDGAGDVVIPDPDIEINIEISTVAPVAVEVVAVGVGKELIENEFVPVPIVTEEQEQEVKDTQDEVPVPVPNVEVSTNEGENVNSAATTTAPPVNVPPVDENDTSL